MLTNQNTRQEIKKKPKSNMTLIANSDLWHKRIGYIGPKALYQLGKHTLGTKIHGPFITKCPDYIIAKIT